MLADCPCVSIARIWLSSVARVELEEEVPWVVLVVLLVVLLVELDAF